MAFPLFPLPQNSVQGDDPNIIYHHPNDHIQRLTSLAEIYMAVSMDPTIFPPTNSRPKAWASQLGAAVPDASCAHDPYK